MVLIEKCGLLAMLTMAIVALTLITARRWPKLKLQPKIGYLLCYPAFVLLLGNVIFSSRPMTMFVASLLICVSGFLRVGEPPLWRRTERYSDTAHGGES